MSNRFGVQSCCFQLVPLHRLLYYVSNPHVSRFRMWVGLITRSNYSRVQLVLCPMLLYPIGPVYPMLLSCFQSKCVQSVLCPIPTGRNWFCVQLDLCPVFLCPIGPCPIRMCATGHYSFDLRGRPTWSLSLSLFLSLAPWSIVCPCCMEYTVVYTPQAEHRLTFPFHFSVTGGASFPPQSSQNDFTRQVSVPWRTTV